MIGQNPVMGFALFLYVFKANKKFGGCLMTVLYGWAEGGKVQQRVYSGSSNWIAITRARIRVSGTVVNSTTYQLKIEGQTRSGNDACNGNRLAEWGVHVYSGYNTAGGVAGREVETYGKHDYCNWVALSTCTQNFPRKASPYTVTCYVRQKTSDMNPGTVSWQATIPAWDVQVPPVVTGVTATIDANNLVTVSWTNNGSGQNAPTSNYVDVQIDDGEWTNISKDSLITSTTYQCEDNHKYVFRVNSVNSAGQNTHQASNVIYTKPAAPQYVASSITKSAGKYHVKINVNFENVRYPSQLYIQLAQKDTIAALAYISVTDESILLSKNYYYQIDIDPNIDDSNENYLLLQNIVALKNNTISSIIIYAGTLADNAYGDVNTSEITHVSVVPRVMFQLPTNKTIQKEVTTQVCKDKNVYYIEKIQTFTISEPAGKFIIDILSVSGDPLADFGASLMFWKRGIPQSERYPLQSGGTRQTIEASLPQGEYSFGFELESGYTEFPGDSILITSAIVKEMKSVPAPIKNIYLRSGAKNIWFRTSSDTAPQNDVVENSIWNVKNVSLSGQTITTNSKMNAAVTDETLYLNEKGA